MKRRSTPLNDRILVGVVTALLCAWGLWAERWFLAETRKGRALVRRFGPERAAWILRALCAAGIVFGTLLAIGVIRPVQW